ncbi:hypothetical protein I6U48_27130 [Clostridium sp. PL3]|uniref:Uncharacterized protein n=1 Tax=Clostridium thailandense TaxID=2794346 RepID=A0A949TWD0_9CLOT|nr:hypothetical protein [Clostridium thailandense]MBV7276552.1 hypothetical protein [Clostridium thailandense]
MTDLQQFTTKFFDTLGAAIVEVDYALIQVLVPDEYTDIFRKTELKLCFDYEVYLENQEYELVTFGSFILDKILDLSFKLSNTCIRYAIAENLTVHDAEMKILNFLNLDRANIKIVQETKLINYLTKYSFKVSYVSDNTVEEFENIVVDMNSNSISQDFCNNLDSIFYETRPLYDFPLNCNIDFLQGFKAALKELDIIKTSKLDKLSNNLALSKETERINLYYASLKEEAEKRMSRKNLSEEKINEYKHKIEIYNLENNRQLTEIVEKYKVKSEIHLENAVIYAVPVICFTYKMVEKNTSDEEFKCFYNAALKKFNN